MKLSIHRVVQKWKYAQHVIPKLNFQPNTAGAGRGFGRRFATQDEAPYWAEAFAEFGLKPTCVEPVFKNMTGNNYAEGAFVHPHMDPAPDGFVHTRCNVMLRKPQTGGNPVLDGEEIAVEEGDMWLCLASLELHSTTPISGGERLIFSFGGLVPYEQVQRILA
jgi:hypothetical protein